MIGLTYDELVTEALFPLDTPPDPAPALTPPPARDEQIAAIRLALDNAKLLEQTERQEFVQSVALRRVSHLRELTSIEARRVLDRLREKQARSSSSTGSAWDEREHETWIDRL